MLHHQWRKPFEALISWAKLGEIDRQRGDGWGHFSQRRDRENALENMPLKVTRISRKNKIVWRAGNWLEITTGVETLNEMWRKAVRKHNGLSLLLLSQACLVLTKNEVLSQIMFLFLL